MPRAAPFGLPFEEAHHFRPHDAVGKSGVVFYVGGEHQLPAGHNVEGAFLTRFVGVEGGVEIRPSSINGGCIAGGA